MTYVYEAILERVDGSWVGCVPVFPSNCGVSSGGDNIKEAVENIAAALRFVIADYIEQGKKLPRAVFSNPPQVVLCVEVDNLFVESTKCLTVTQAAEELGVSRGRISQLIDSGALDGTIVGGKRMITIASVNERKKNPPAAHRPRKA
ncbi:MAG: type II toxin-antitoxin system HicB family antitoxin [Atopobium sp.]|uniref:type II toxin-antitoxin system HicB family antitoxin n=1 Tax=Atopobium sp. TaxID=1872650 RepID=UPI002A832895|nr:type II toxin-antitoxin system HicB family antitoxin [Atopobium sp.]MDY4522918.1 type II toxin-antitoxin system HicB family antitoxin [Atopobium sp.]